MIAGSRAVERDFPVVDQRDDADPHHVAVHGHGVRGDVRGIGQTQHPARIEGDGPGAKRNSLYDPLAKASVPALMVVPPV